MAGNSCVFTCWKPFCLEALLTWSTAASHGSWQSTEVVLAASTTGWRTEEKRPRPSRDFGTSARISNHSASMSMCGLLVAVGIPAVTRVDERSRCILQRHAVLGGAGLLSKWPATPQNGNFLRRRSSFLMCISASASRLAHRQGGSGRRTRGSMCCSVWEAILK